MFDSSRISEIQRSQHSLIARPQALAAGMTDDDLKALVHRGIWVAPHGGVYAPAGAPRSPQFDTMAAVLAGGPGTVASHASAAWLWDLGPIPDHVEITVTRSRAPRPHGVVRHRSLDLAEATPSLRLGIPVTNPLRTLVDLGAGGDVQRVRDATHVAVSRRLVTYAALEAELRRLAKRGRRGVGAMRVVLSERFDRRRGPSVLEAKMDLVIRRAGVPQPRVERIVGPNGEYRCDYISDDALLIVEAKGYETHGTPDAFAADLIREAAIVEAGGYQILPVGYWQATKGASVLARQIRTLYFARRKLLLGA